MEAQLLPLKGNEKHERERIAFFFDSQRMSQGRKTEYKWWQPFLSFFFASVCFFFVESLASTSLPLLTPSDFNWIWCWYFYIRPHILLLPSSSPRDMHSNVYAFESCIKGDWKARGKKSIKERRDFPSWKKGFMCLLSTFLWKRLLCLRERRRHNSLNTKFEAAKTSLKPLIIFWSTRRHFPHLLFHSSLASSSSHNE